jgi:DNA-binding NarL/FixJ family response regulator
VLERLARGEGNKAIAQALGLTPMAVEAHVSAIYRRVPFATGRSKRRAASAWYLREGHRYREGGDGP